jgi:hypothetical protein
MCLMHEATPYGQLLINGRPPTDMQLASLAGTPVDQIPGLLEELENAGVFSRTRSGVVYSRRMTRDEKKRKDGEKSQKTGGKLPNSRRSQAAEKKRENLPPGEVVGGVVSKPPSTQKPEARRQIEEKEEGKPSSQNDGGDLFGEKPKRGTRIPQGAVLPEDWRAFALSEGHPDPEREWLKFSDYWRSQPGQKGVKLDWEATWRNWIRRAMENGAANRGTAGNRPRNGFVEIITSGELG